LEIPLTPEYINTLPRIIFNGVIEVLDDGKRLTEIISELSNRQIVGVDTESRPSFVKGKTYPISLIQLATLENVYIVRLKYTGFTKELGDFFESSVIKVGIAISDDLIKLKQFGVFTPKNLVDLGELARRQGNVRSSLRTLCAKYLGSKLVKSAQKTNWARHELTETQLRYAATDAWICLLLLPHLTSQ
jgi:ribonuclease D